MYIYVYYESQARRLGATVNRGVRGEKHESGDPFRDAPAGNDHRSPRGDPKRGI